MIAGRNVEAGSSMVRTMRNVAPVSDLEAKQGATQGFEEVGVGVGTGIGERGPRFGFERVDLGEQRDTRRFLDSIISQFSPSSSNSSSPSASATTSAAASRTEVGWSTGLDYLIITAGKTPTGSWSLNKDGIESHFAIQCLGRFNAVRALSPLLVPSPSPSFQTRDGQSTGQQGLGNGSGNGKEKGKSRGKILVVCAPGQGKSLDPTDPTCSTPALRRKYNLLTAGRRDSLFLDAILLEATIRYPGLEIKHLFPGLIATKAARNAGFPWPIPTLAEIVTPWIFTGADKYAEIPFYELTRDLMTDSAHNITETETGAGAGAAAAIGTGTGTAGQGSVSRGGYAGLDQWGRKVQVPAWAQNPENRRLLWTWSEDRIASVLSQGSIAGN